MSGSVHYQNWEQFFRVPCLDCQNPPWHAQMYFPRLPGHVKNKRFFLGENKTASEDTGGLNKFKWGRMSTTFKSSMSRVKNRFFLHDLGNEVKLKDAHV